MKNSKIILAFILLVLDLFSYVPKILESIAAPNISIYMLTAQPFKTLVNLRWSMAPGGFFNPFLMTIIDIAVTVFGIVVSIAYIRSCERAVGRLGTAAGVLLLLLSISNVVISFIVLENFGAMP